MRVLIDSHVFVWTLLQDRRVSTAVRRIIFSNEHELFFSIVSLWELSIVIRLGRIRDLTSSIAFLHDQLGEFRITLLPLRYEDILATEHLDPHHRDPFDRLLIAQAVANDLTLLTGDVTVRRYPVKTVW